MLIFCWGSIPLQNILYMDGLIEAWIFRKVDATNIFNEEKTA